MPIDTLPNLAEFGAPKTNAGVIVSPSEQASAGDFNAMANRLVQFGLEIGLSDGSTPGSLRKAINDAAGTGGGAAKAVVWDPDIAASEGNVYKTLAEAMAQLEDVEGTATLILDTSSIVDLTGEHTLACRVFEIVAGGKQVTATTFVLNAPDLYRLVLDGIQIQHDNDTAFFTTVAGRAFIIDLVANAAITNTGSAEAIHVVENGMAIVLLGNYTQLDGDTYEVFACDDNSQCLIFVNGIQAFVGDNTVRGDPFVAGAYYSSAVSSRPSNVQPNLIPPFVINDTAAYLELRPLCIAHARYNGAAVEVPFDPNPSVRLPLDTVDLTAGPGGEIPEVDTTNNVIRIQRAGLYKVMARATLVAPAATSGNIGLILIRNAISPTGLIHAQTATLDAPSISTKTCLSFSIEVELDSLDELFVYLYNDTDQDIESESGTLPYNQHVIPVLQVTEVRR